MKPPHIPMKNCKSSTVIAHGYDAASNTMAVKYKSGRTYHYAGVSPEKYAALCAAESVGKHLHAHIYGAHDSKLIGKD